MEQNKLYYFKCAKELNEEFYEELISKRAHFRGSFNSIALISLDEKTPEIGKSFHSKKGAENGLSCFNPQKPGRLTTPEKKLQAWIILNALNNGNKLPFDANLTFISSEVAIVLDNNKRIVNDILALDEQDKLVVIELKTIRVTEVKEQALRFKKVIEERKECFYELTKLMTGREWNGEVRSMIVWPATNGGKERACKPEYADVEEYVYSGNYEFDKIK